MTAPAAPAVTATLTVSEVFGPTFQGEGPSTGVRASFIRLGGCNLSCRWCDTPYTWDATRHDLRAELGRVAVADILDRLEDHDAPLVVITGGEPLLHQHQPAWVELLDGITAQGRTIEIETNGTQCPTIDTVNAARFNVSPKLDHAGDPEAKRIRPGVLAALDATGAACFKFVATAPSDLAQVQDIVDAASIPPHRVWIMPCGTDADTVLSGMQTLADPTTAAGFNLTTRLHVLLWGNERSR